MAIKITAKRRAYFNGEIIKPGQIITFKGNNIPSWAKRAGTGKTEEEKTPPAENASAQQSLLQTETTIQADNTATEQTAGELDLTGKTEEELNIMLDELITKAIEVDAYISNVESKTVIEQIQELDEAIKKKNNENKGK